jgi:hypothetical protein
MKNPYSPCKNAAERVKYLFSHYSFFLKQKLAIRSSFHSHHCNLVKLPRLSAKVGNLSLLGYEITKARKTSLPPSKKVISVNAQKHSLPLHSHPHPLPTNGKDLKSERVQRWKLNEQLVASRRLKSLKQRETDFLNERKVKHEISLIQEDSSKNDDQRRQQNHWEEFLRSKEERQYNITRITKFFID